MTKWKAKKKKIFDEGWFTCVYNEKNDIVAMTIGMNGINSYDMAKIIAQMPIMFKLLKDCMKEKQDKCALCRPIDCKGCPTGIWIKKYKKLMSIK